ncbi:MAG: uracil-DNA glycosylase [Hyphomicrobiales bacterium]|nr:MAG: uracil-DNA glycosylase [Hyphomicrobiales bacterium]
MSTTNDRIRGFVQMVADLKFENTFNPYTDTCPQFDRLDAPAIRRNNLHAVLQAAVERGVSSIWVARDLGYRGGRRTGLALTDEANLGHHSKLLQTAALRKSTEGPVVAERTAAVIWQMLLQINQPIFLWNVFPLHPHMANEPMSNRCHTRTERLAGRSVIDELMKLLQPQFVLAIGRDAQASLLELGIASEAVRHPSYGGQTEFATEVARRYSLPTSTSQQSFSF